MVAYYFLVLPSVPFWCFSLGKNLTQIMVTPRANACAIAVYSTQHPTSRMRVAQRRGPRTLLACEPETLYPAFRIADRTCSSDMVEQCTLLHIDGAVQYSGESWSSSAMT